MHLEEQDYECNNPNHANTQRSNSKHTHAVNKTAINTVSACLLIMNYFNHSLVVQILSWGMWGLNTKLTECNHGRWSKHS